MQRAHRMVLAWLPRTARRIAGGGHDGWWTNASSRKRGTVIHWKQINEFIEPNWEKPGTEGVANLFWRGAKGAVFGFIRDGELFDNKWLYVCELQQGDAFFRDQRAG